MCIASQRWHRACPTEAQKAASWGGGCLDPRPAVENALLRRRGGATRAEH